jgi:ligand-binding sensor domain-containing protein
MSRRARLIAAVATAVAVAAVALAVRFVRETRSRVEIAAAGGPTVEVGEGWSGVRRAADVTLGPAEPGEGEHPSLIDVRAVLTREEGSWLGTTGGLVFVGRGEGTPRVYTARGGLLRNDVIALAGAADTVAVAHPEEGISLIRGDRVRVISHPELVPTALAAAEGGFYVGTADRGLLWLTDEGLFPVPIAGGEGEVAWSLGDVRVSAVAVEPVSGELWIGTFDRGAAVRREGSWALLGTADGLADPFVTSLALEWTERGTRALIGTQTGLSILEGERAPRIVGRAEGLPDDHVAAVALDDGRMAVGTYGGGLALFEGEGWSSVGTPDLPSAYAQAVAFDGRGGLWIGTRSGAVSREQGRWKAVALPDGPPGARITALAAQRGAAGDELWVGTFERGVGRRLGGVWTSLVEADGLPSDEINALALHRDVLWAATNAGAAYFADGAFRQHPRLAELRGTAVTALHSAGDALWLGTASGAVRLAGDGAVVRHGIRDGLVNGHVYALARDGERVWAGTLGGLSGLRADGARDPAGAIAVRSGPGGLSHGWVNALVAAPERLWVGTYGGGVDVYDGVEWSRVYPDGDATLEVNPGAGCLVGETPVFGTLDRGLLVLGAQGDAPRLLRADLGLPCPSVTALEMDGDQLWIGTAAGLVAVAPDSVR